MTGFYCTSMANYQSTCPMLFIFWLLLE